MQFVEKNGYDVRSAIYHLKKDNSGLEFILFPMIHVGSPEFYEQVKARLSECDLILAEGVKSRRVQYLTYSYRVIRKIKRMELVTQSEALKLADFRDKVVNADLDGQMFDQRWSQLPLSLRLMIIFGLPVYVVYLFLYGTKESLAAQMALDDLPSREKELMYDERDEVLNKLLIDERDQQLIGQIEEIGQAGCGERKVVGIVYGAMHMRAVMNVMLHKLRYRVADAQWITVFYL